MLRHSLRCALIAWCVAILGSASATPTLQPMQFTAFCLDYPADCAPTLGKPVEELDSHELEVVNALTNAAIVPLNVRTRRWQIYPEEGACGDYAVSKRHALLERGWPSARLLLAEVILQEDGRHHLVLVARDRIGIWVLDNLQSRLATMAEFERRYVLVRVQSASDPRIWDTALKW